MKSELRTNEYGKYLIKPFGKSKTKRVIVLLHNFVDDIEFDKEFSEQLKGFHYYSFCLPCDIQEEFDESEFKLTVDNYLQYIKDLIISLNLEQIFLISYGTSCLFATILMDQLERRFVKAVFVNPITYNSNERVFDLATFLPKDIDESYDHLKKVYGSSSDKLVRKNKSNEVIIYARKTIYNRDILLKFLKEIRSEEFSMRVKKSSRVISCPMLVINSQNCDMSSGDVKRAFGRDIEIVKFKNAYYFPILNDKDQYVDLIMKFFIRDTKLYSLKRLPNAYIYEFLDDDVKLHYEEHFGEKLAARNERIAKKKSKILHFDTDRFVLDEEAEQLEEQKTAALNYLAESSEYISHIVNEANIKSEGILANANKVQDPSKLNIEFDWSMPQNEVYRNSQGYEVFHDGKNAFYRDEYEVWVMFK